ncbi:hypothetical protein F8O07_07135 [Pseudoclavibacter sp. CFCC 13796]|uniref:hypothetical protein n=1 Tax=Pseudoclavibacter sp. CFCC 13796 TaxID=2615179 RepID=UPI001300E70A|nr:hypothetical protein [Pseudoclavibacter sp. CFCC 13796]KAB1661671.1 hypothetical protein F8O07_07135 [Pseudoclavibacter sp. CFCC 13796]
MAQQYEVTVAFEQTATVTVEAESAVEAAALGRAQLVDGWTIRSEQVTGLATARAAQSEGELSAAA